MHSVKQLVDEIIAERPNIRRKAQKRSRPNTSIIEEFMKKKGKGGKKPC